MKKPSLQLLSQSLVVIIGILSWISSIQAAAQCGGKDTTDNCTCTYLASGQRRNCNDAKPNTCNGTAHNNEIRCNDSTNGCVINGQAGNDRITGSTGKDFICGGSSLTKSGNDRLVGDVGDDVIYGGSGNDNLFGNNGVDNLDGGSGTQDNLNGGPHNDNCLSGENIINCP